MSAPRHRWGAMLLMSALLFLIAIRVEAQTPTPEAPQPPRMIEKLFEASPATGGAKLLSSEIQIEGAAAQVAQAQPLPAPAPQRIDTGRGGELITPQGPLAPQMFGPGQTRLPLLGYSDGTDAIPNPSDQTRSHYAKFVEPSQIKPEMLLDLIDGRTYILKLKQKPRRFQIDDRVVSADLITELELSLTGRSELQQGIDNNQTGNRGGNLARSTVLNLWFDDPESPERQTVLSYLVRVIPNPNTKLDLEKKYKALADEVNRLFPNSNIRLILVGDRLAVQGEAKDIVEAAQILQIVSANAPNNTNVEPLNVGNLNVVVNPQTNAISTVDGEPAVSTPGEATGLLEQLAQRSSNLINLIRVSGEQQVMLKVTLAEVQRTAARAIGINFNVTGDNGISFASLPTSGLTVTAQNAGAGGGIPINFDPTTGVGRGSNFVVNRGDFQMAVNALSTLGLARTLAEPNLVALNGQIATFRAGTDVAVTNNTVIQGAVLNNFAQVFAGITLNFTPYITERDRVRLRMVAQVSAVSSTNAAGQPNITQRTVQTVVELRDGQTLAVAGVLQTNYNNSASGLPFLGFAPVVGRLFRSDTTNTTENELMIIVTPELVHPLECHEQPPLPGDDTFEPSDYEFFVKGRLESLRSEDYRAGARTSWDRMNAYYRCQQKFIIGPVGYSDGK